MGDGESRETLVDRATFWGVAAATVYFEVSVVFRFRATWTSVAFPIATAIGFFGSSLMEWLRLYVFWHPKSGVRRGDEAALRRVDRAIWMVIAAGVVLVLISSFTDWIPFLPSYMIMGLALGFFLHQYVPDKAKDRVQRVTGRLFVRMFRAPMTRRDG